MPTAVLIDGAYFLRRFHSSFPNLDANSAKDVEIGVIAMAAYHLSVRLGPQQMIAAMDHAKFRFEESEYLYRIFFYDCAPLTKRVHWPISNRSHDLAKTPQAIARIQLHRQLRSVRKVALRLGRLHDVSDWRMKVECQNRIISGTPYTITDDDFELNIVQKGVDMRLGLDVASLAFKKQVDQIILVAGDADFVPAVKLARREGIDVVLDPMGQTPAADLAEHVDGIRNCRVDLKPRDKN
jgi:uncharacterized protein (TIGR00288 family)